MFQVSSELVITIYSVLILVDVVEVKEVKLMKGAGIKKIPPRHSHEGVMQ